MNPRKQALIHWYEHEIRSSEQMINAIPDQKIRTKVHPKVRTIGELGIHLADSILDLAKSLSSGSVVFSEPSKVPDTKEEILAHYRSCAREFLGVARNLTDEQLNMKYKFEINGQVIWEPDGYEFMSGYFCHEIHHRGQMVVVLRLLGEKVPGLYGPTGDELPA